MVVLPGYFAKPISACTDDSGYEEEEGAAEHCCSGVVGSNREATVMPHPVRDYQSSACDTGDDVNVKQRPFDAASACENQHDAERSAECDQEPTGFCRGGCPDENPLQCKDEEDDQRHSPERVNHDGNEIGHACRWPGIDVRGSEEQDREQNRDSALHSSPGSAREWWRRDTVVFVGKEACILIRMARVNNNTFILEARRDENGRAALQNAPLAVSEYVIHRMAYSPINRYPVIAA